MENNEEKMILVLEADKSNLNQLIFDLSWEHLGKIKGNEISRAKAIEKMAKAVCMRVMYGCERCAFGKDKEKCEEWIAFNHIREAEAALNALLEDNK